MRTFLSFLNSAVCTLNSAFFCYPDLNRDFQVSICGFDWIKMSHVRQGIIEVSTWSSTRRLMFDTD
jgi:hypothetical protein